MTALVTIHYPRTPLRIVKEDGELYFCFADIVSIMDLQNTDKILRHLRLEFGDNNLRTFTLPEFELDTSFMLNERQLYFVVMRPHSTKAREFRQWLYQQISDLHTNK